MRPVMNRLRGVLSLFLQALCNGDQIVQLITTQSFGSIQKLICLCGVDCVRVKEFLGRDAEVVADIEENRHGRIVDAVFNVVDVASALTNG